MARMSRFGMITGVCACLLGAIAPARAESERAILALPAEGMNFLAYYVAEDLGLFAQQQLEIKSVVIAGVGSFNAVVSGSVEFSFSSGSSLTRAAAHGQRMLALAQMNNLPVWDIVVRKDIADAAHFDPKAPLALRAQILKGRTMGIQGVNALDHAYLKIVAKIGGSELEGITVAAMAPPDTLAAFSRKSIDGFVSGPPWAQQVEDDGSAVAVAIGPNGEPGSLVPIASSLLITRPQLCVEHRSLCMKMGHAMVLASKAVHERPQDVLALLQKRFDKVKPSVLPRSLDALAKIMPPVPKVDLVALRKADEINVDAGFMQPGDLLKSYDGLSSDEFVQ
ncbi:MAG TPA: ABC transporter substrate-binding protein [Stellaceae bacterium]|nr:ABC transporter substrate-binding protein [Stellaceae bacterium]